MSSPLVSVILIGYNDADRLPRAIESILTQTLHDLELVIVDDASTDGTPDVVSSFVRTDHRVVPIRLDVNSGGCSAPRNAGLNAARGRYVMFADSDDEYEMHACMNLVSAAEEWNADLVCGTAVRLIEASGERIRWRPELHSDRRAVTSLAQCTDLLYDTIAVNKIYRRDFLVRNGIHFPEGVLFEDQPFTLECMMRAQTIGVIPEDVYVWHVVREGDQISITQSRRELRNLRDRITVNQMMDALIGSDDAVAEAKQVKFLRHEAYLYLSTIADSADDTARDLMALLAPYIAAQSIEAFDAVRPLVRVALYGLLIDDLELLRSAMRFETWASVVDARLVHEEGRTFWRAPEGEQVLGRSPRYWLDVSALRLLRVPFSQRRYLHLVHRLDEGPGGLEVEITTVDYAGDLADLEHAVLTLSASQGRRWELPLHRVSAADGVITWRAHGRLKGLHVLRAGLHGSVGVAMERGGYENLTPVRAVRDHRITLEHPESHWGAPDAIEIVPAQRGGLLWRATGRSTSLGSALRRLRSRNHHVPSGRSAVQLPGDRAAVVLAMAPRPGVGPASPPSVELDDWVHSLGDGTYLLVVDNAEDPIPVPTRWRGSARTITHEQWGDLVQRPEALALVCGDDPRVLEPAHQVNIPTILFRPDRSAIEYALAPIDAPEHATTMEALIVAADAVLARRGEPG